MRRYGHRLALAALLASALGIAACDTGSDDLLLGPINLSPVDSTTFSLASSIDLTWETVSEATAYRVEVAHTPDYTNLVEVAQTGIAHATVGPFPKGIYYWHVIPIAPGGARGRPSGDNIFIVEDQRTVPAVLSWSFAIAPGASGEIEVASSGDGGLAGLFAGAGIPETAQVRRMDLRRVTLRRTSPDGLALSGIGSDFRLLVQRAPGELTAVARLDTPPSTATAEMAVLSPATVPLTQRPSTVLRLTPAADLPQSAVLEVSVLSDLFVVVP